MKPSRLFFRAPLCAWALLFAAITTLQAGSATWNLNPVSSDWTDAANWSPETVPNGPADIATFGASNLPNVMLSGEDASYELGSIVFAADASPYNVTFVSVAPLTISGAGVLNQSALTQNMVLPYQGYRTIFFANESSAGDNIVYTVAGRGGSTGGEIDFHDSSSAGSATFQNNGFLTFYDAATAGTATFSNNAATTAHGDAGSCTFNNPSTADGGFATFINQGAAIPSANGGGVFLDGSGSLRHCTIINYGASATNTAGGGRTEIGNHTNAAQSTLIAYGGTNGGDPGFIQFNGSASGGKAQVQLYGEGRLEIILRSQTAPTLSIGSLSGDGLATLGQYQLNVGNDNRDSTFTGQIQDGGVEGGTGASLAKSGTGRFVLQGANTYTGGTFVNAGELRLVGVGGSPTGTGPVQVNGGRLSGKALMTGAVTIGKGDGTGAFFAPGRHGEAVNLGSRTNLTFKSDGTLMSVINSSANTAAEAVGNDITIDPAAHFTLTDAGATTLPAGTSFVVMNNTSAVATRGAFANLPEGGTITAGSNTYQVSYSGGDGNDLTLTVVP